MGAKSEDEAEVRYCSTYLTLRRFFEKSSVQKIVLAYNEVVVEN